MRTDIGSLGRGLIAVRQVIAAVLIVGTTTGSVPLHSSPASTVSAPAVFDSHRATIDALLAEERYEVADAGARGLAELTGPGCLAFSGEPDTRGIPAAEALADLSFTPALQACCRVCTTGKACGNSCISRAFNCYQGVGCACDAGPVVPPPALAPSITVSRQSAYPRVGVGGTAELSVGLTVIFATWFAGDVEMRVTNTDEAGRGLRGWDSQGVIGVNTAGSFGLQSFRALVQGLAPGVHRLRIGFFHRTLGQIGPDGVYWDVSVEAVPSVSRLYEGWHSRWVAQSSYPSMRPGDVAEFWIRFANVGTETWNRGIWGRQVNLALNGDDKEPYRLGMAVNWLWDDRIATTQVPSVGPTHVAEFRFAVRAPAAAGRYLLNLRPVVDGTTWLEDEGVFWVVEVR